MYIDERRGLAKHRNKNQKRTPCKEKSIAPFRLGNVGATMDDKRVEWNGDKEQKAIDILSKTGRGFPPRSLCSALAMTFFRHDI
jgi:hypothetical protein